MLDAQDQRDAAGAAWSSVGSDLSVLPVLAVRAVLLGLLFGHFRRGLRADPANQRLVVDVPRVIPTRGLSGIDGCGRGERQK